jgi:hypothetical protein
MTALVTAERLADAVRRRFEASASDVNAYWMCVREDRDAYAATLNDELVTEPIVVVVVRDNRFTIPNALSSDFIEVVSQNQRACEQRIDRSHTKCGFVLLSRSELGIAQIASPVLLPTWFPIKGGTTVSMLIEDLTWTADAPLGAAEVRVDELCEGLLDLEEALLRRLGEVLAQDSDRRKTMAFLDLIRRENGEKLNEVLDSATDHHAAITTPSAFRPSLREGHSLIARLWGTVQERPPEQMKAPSKALADALDLPEELTLEWHESIASVLRRPSGGETSVRLRFGRNILLTVGAVCQMVTAAAHADAYSHYPVALLRSFSYDMRRSLSDGAAVIRALRR